MLGIEFILVQDKLSESQGPSFSVILYKPKLSYSWFEYEVQKGRLFLQFFKRLELVFNFVDNRNWTETYIDKFSKTTLAPYKKDLENLRKQVNNYSCDGSIWDFHNTGDFLDYLSELEVNLPDSAFPLLTGQGTFVSYFDVKTGEVFIIHEGEKEHIKIYDSLSEYINKYTKDYANLTVYVKTLHN